MSSESPGWVHAATARKHRRSDPHQERELVERLRPGLRAVLRRRMPDGLLVEDLLQEALFLIVDHWRQGEISDPPQQILFAHATAIHLASNALRSEERRLRLISDYGHLPRAVEAPSPETELLRLDLLATVRNAVQSMPNARDRELLLRYYVQEHSKPAICADLGLDPRHFDRVLHRARARLREIVMRITVSGETYVALTTLLSQRDSG